MAKNTYTFGDKTFTSQKAVREHFQWIKTRGKCSIGQFDPDFKFLKDLYWRNPWSPAANPFVFDFTYHPNHGGSELGVIVALDNGEVWEFPSAEWGLCTPDQVVDDPWPNWKKIQFRKMKNKMRQMIRYQVETYRDSCTDGKCEVCSEPGVDVDHDDMTFKEIFDLWIQDRDPFGMVIIDNCSDGFDPEFADPDTHADWLEHHATLADFQLLCKECHYKKTHGKKEAA